MYIFNKNKKPHSTEKLNKLIISAGPKGIWYGIICIVLKSLSHLAALPLRLHGILKFPRAQWDRMEIWLFSWRWRCLGVSMFQWSSMAFLRRPVGDCLLSHGTLTARSRSFHCALTALPLRASSCHGTCTMCALRVQGASTACIELSWHMHYVCTARSRSFHCADGVLVAFGGCWNNWQGPHITSPAWWSTSVNISQTKVMYISSRHKQHIINTTDADICYKSR